MTSPTAAASDAAESDASGATAAAGPFPCVCCGHLSLADPPGSYDECPVCGWEDDIVGLRWPDLDQGANQLSLIEAQRLFAVHGYSDPAKAGSVRPATADEPLDDGFRPLDAVVDNVEFSAADDTPYPADSTLLYWWRPTFWRRHA